MFAASGPGSFFDTICFVGTWSLLMLQVVCSWLNLKTHWLLSANAACIARAHAQCLYYPRATPDVYSRLQFGTRQPPGRGRPTSVTSLNDLGLRARFPLVLRHGQLGQRSG
jgi:hypothetical protein